MIRETDGRVWCDCGDPHCGLRPEVVLGMSLAEALALVVFEGAEP